MRNSKKPESWIKKNLTYILGFLIPLLVLGLVFYKNEVIPFGDNIYLRSDMYHQYAPFYKELYNKLVNGGSMTFSWNIGMGVNFSATYAYYLASPVNLLLGFVPKGSILIVMDVLIITKTALAGLGCSYYLSKHFNTKSLSTAAFASFYALSSYMAAFSWNIMWLDCMVLLPFIVLGLEGLIKEKKFKMYTIALGLAIFSNYYIAIMICIFVVLYFLVEVVVYATGEKHYYIDRMIRFAVCSLIAGGLGAAMILPEVYALGYTASGEFSFPETWLNYFSILDMLRRSLIETPVAIFEAHDPNVYFSISMFLFAPLYCLCDKVNKREKIGKIILIAIFLISFNTNIPNYIWHGFHFPNSLPARESFIYIFLMVTIVFEGYLHVKSMTRKQIYGSFAGAIGVILLIEELYQDEVTFNNIYVSIILLVFYMVLVMLDYNKMLYKEISVYLLIVICVAETFINSSEESSYKPTTYSAYLEDNEAIENLVSKVEKEDKDFFRIEKLNRRTKNDAAWNDYRGVSIFSSMANSAFTEYLGVLGFEQSTNAYSYYGYTPFTSALLSVKYVLSDAVQDDMDRYTLVDFDESQNKYLYQVNYCLPLGFMVSDDFDKNLSTEGNNPFAVQNQFAELATGEKDMFRYLSATSSGTTSTIDVSEDAHVYVYVTTYVDSISYTAYNEATGFSSSNSFSGLNHRQIVDFGEMPAGTKVTVSTSDTDAGSLQLYAYNFDEEVFQRVYEDLSSAGMTVTEFDDNTVKGKISAAEDGLLYTSIIYDKGWNVYVDGKKTEFTSIADAQIAVPVSAGEHEIEFKYYPEGRTAGIVISILSLIVLIALFTIDKKMKKKNLALDNSEENENLDLDLIQNILESQISKDETETSEDKVDIELTEESEVIEEPIQEIKE